MSIEAMEQALKALEESVNTTAYNDDREYHYHTCCGAMLGNPHAVGCRQSEAITSLRAAIGEAGHIVDGATSELGDREKLETIYAFSKKLDHVRETLRVNHVYTTKDDHKYLLPIINVEHTLNGVAVEVGDVGVVKTTSPAPPKREWIELTDGEMEETWRESQTFVGLVSFKEIYRAIEAKLKEKNQ